MMKLSTTIAEPTHHPRPRLHPPHPHPHFPQPSFFFLLFLVVASLRSPSSVVQVPLLPPQPHHRQ